MEPASFQKMGIKESLELALKLGEQALREFPDADELYIGGGSWMVVPIVAELERRLGKPVITNQSSLIWHTLHAVNYWTPIKGYGRLLASA